MCASPKTILIVDDDHEIVVAHKLLLEDFGYHVFVAYDAQSGLKTARAVKPDLVIMDVIMDTPDAGFELCRNLHAEESLKDTRLLLVTAVAEKYQMSFEPGGMWLPADKFLEKPVDSETLLTEVGRILGSSNT